MNMRDEFMDRGCLVKFTVRAKSLGIIEPEARYQDGPQCVPQIKGNSVGNSQLCLSCLYPVSYYSACSHKASDI